MNENSKKILIATGTTRDEHDLMYALSQKLSDQGYKIVLVSGYANSHSTEEWKKHQLKFPHEFVGENFEIIRVGSSKQENRNVIIRGIRFINLTYQIYKAARDISADYYMFNSTPPFMGVVSSKLGKKGKYTIYLAQDIFPDTLINVYNISEKSLITKALRFIETKIYKNTSKIITITNTMKETLSKRVDNSDKIHVIRTWADIELIRPISRKDNILFDELKIDRNKFIVSFAGNIGMFQNVEELVKSAKYLKDNNNILFVIIGNGVRKKEVQEIVNNERLNNVLLFPLQSANMLSEVYSLGNIEVACIQKNVTKMACPHKIFDILSAGSPLLAIMDNDCDTADIIRNKNLGYVISTYDAKTIAKEIRRIYSEKDDLTIKGNNSRMYAETISFDKQIQKYIQIFK